VPVSSRVLQRVFHRVGVSYQVVAAPLLFDRDGCSFHGSESPQKVSAMASGVSPPRGQLICSVLSGGHDASADSNKTTSARKQAALSLILRAANARRPRRHPKLCARGNHASS